MACRGHLVLPYHSYFNLAPDPLIFTSPLGILDTTFLKSASASDAADLRVLYQNMQLNSLSYHASCLSDIH